MSMDWSIYALSVMDKMSVSGERLPLAPVFQKARGQFAIAEFAVREKVAVPVNCSDAAPAEMPALQLTLES